MDIHGDLTRDTIEEMEEMDIQDNVEKLGVLMTICSNMHCYNRAEETNDPLRPPFCISCTKKKKGTDIVADVEA